MDAELETALLLHRAPLFAELSPESLLPVARLSSYQALDAGQVLFEQGSFGDALFVVVGGCLRVLRQGQELTRFGPGESVGEIAVLDWQPRSASVVADTPTTVLRVERHDLIDLLQQEPLLLRSLIALLSRRIRDTA